MYRAPCELKDLLASRTENMKNRSVDDQNAFVTNTTTFLGPRLWDNVPSIDITDENIENHSAASNDFQYNECLYDIIDNIFSDSSNVSELCANQSNSSLEGKDKNEFSDESILYNTCSDTGLAKKKGVSPEMKGEKYWNRRMRNNASAKKSRDARKKKENEILLRATYLEKENEELRQQIKTLASENSCLRQALNKTSFHPVQEYNKPSNYLDYLNDVLSNNPT